MTAQSALSTISLWGALLMGSAAAQAALQDEIQVYDDGINAPGEFGTELHVNMTPSGRGTPDYPGEKRSVHGLRVTPEFSWGLSKDWEAGLYVPVVRSQGGSTELPGVKLRMKWIPLHADEHSGLFGGLNLELSRVKRVYDEATSSAQLKVIAGHRGPAWLLAANLNFGKAYAGPDKASRPELGIGLKAARRVAPGWSPGVEYYQDSGPLFRALPREQQDRRLFATLDVDQGPVPFNVGIGRGLTDGADKWTVKAIFEIPMPGR